MHVDGTFEAGADNCNGAKIEKELDLLKSPRRQMVNKRQR